MIDDEKEKLSGDNDYILSGFPPNSPYWSFVIYDFDNRRIEPFEETVANSYQTPIKKNGSYEITLTKHPDNYPGKQVINHAGANFSIIMRMYGPILKYYTDKESIPVGSIKKVKYNG